MILPSLVGERAQNATSKIDIWYGVTQIDETANQLPVPLDPIWL